jgi:hypothetical protein
MTNSAPIIPRRLPRSHPDAPIPHNDSREKVSYQQCDFAGCTERAHMRIRGVWEDPRPPGVESKAYPGPTLEVCKVHAAIFDCGAHMCGATVQREFLEVGALCPRCGCDKTLESRRRRCLAYDVGSPSGCRLGN